MKCPVCEKGELKKGKIREELFGVELGEFPAEICTKCRESFTDEATTKKIEEAAKKKGIWGLGRKTNIALAGNSLAVRIPQAIAKYLNLKKGEEVFIHPADHKIVIEPMQAQERRSQ